MIVTRLAPRRSSLRINSALLATVLVFITGTTVAFGAGTRLPDGPGVDLVYSHCQTCHSLSYVEEAKGLLPTQWEALIAGMQDYGLEISDDDKRKVLAYLKTYLGPNPPPAAKPNSQPEQIDASTVFAQNCAACHGKAGLGQPGYFPPLAGNADLFRDRVFPVLVVLNGLEGKITVAGQSYNGSMPPFERLSDAKIAAIVNYVRGAWDNKQQKPSFEPVTPAVVAKQRARDLSAADVHAIRGKSHEAAN